MDDIFEIAKTYGFSDYYDFSTGYTYLISEYNQRKALGFPTLYPGIRVMNESGAIIGVVPEPEKSK